MRLRGLGLVCLWLLAACGRRERQAAESLARGRVPAGRIALQTRGCGSCHQIPGVEAADGQVGPSLEGIAGRSYLAGRLENTPAGMTRWIQHPQGIDPGNVMPEMGVPDQEARDMAAYLYTLQ
jgi:cytochrome c2